MVTWTLQKPAHAQPTRTLILEKEGSPSGQFSWLTASTGLSFLQPTECWPLVFSPPLDSKGVASACTPLCPSTAAKSTKHSNCGLVAQEPTLVQTRLPAAPCGAAPALEASQRQTESRSGATGCVAPAAGGRTQTPSLLHSTGCSRPCFHRAPQLAPEQSCPTKGDERKMGGP